MSEGTANLEEIWRKEAPKGFALLFDVSVGLSSLGARGRPGSCPRTSLHRREAAALTDSLARNNAFTGSLSALGRRSDPDLFPDLPQHIVGLQVIG